MAQRRQPHIYGAEPAHYRKGGAVASGESPPTWAPELENDSLYPYTLAEWRKDIGRWMAATKVSADRQGPLLALSLGTSAQTLVDDLPDSVLAHGAVVDLNDGSGHIHHSGVEILFHMLLQKFPPDLEAQMLRYGLDFFSFTPTREENLKSLFLRFDTLLDRANT